MHSFPMNPSVFYAFRDWSFYIKNFERPITMVLELLIRQDDERIHIKQGHAKHPEFLIVSRPSDGFMKATLKSAESTIRSVLFARPTGDVLSGGGIGVSEISTLFSALPIPDGNFVMRFPVVVADNLQFETKTGNIFPVESALFEMKPQKFGFIFANEKGLKELIGSMEEKIRTGFLSMDGKELKG